MALDYTAFRRDQNGRRPARMAYDISLQPLHRWFLAVLLVGVYLLPGLAILPKLGIEVDEALITNAIYEGGAPLYSWHFGGTEIPIMILTYLGALKAWVYNAIFLIWAPSELSLRLPTLLLGVPTIWLFWKLLRDVLNERAAWIGAALLATDTVFLLTETIDFGFVALQQFLKLGGLVLLLKFFRNGRSAWLAGGFFLFGVGVWDKALFGWILVGLAAAALAIYPREVLARISWRNAAIASAALTLGAFPFLAYNIARPAETLRANANLQSGNSLGKVVLAHMTMNGSVGFGFFVASEAGPKPGIPRSRTARVAFQISRWFGGPEANLTAIAFVLCLLVLPFARPVWRPVAFALVFMLVTWLQMAFTSGAGAAAHHVILLWPAHFFVMAAIFAQWRWAAVPAVLVCASSLLVSNQTYVELMQNGPGLRWTDAIRPLTSVIEKQKAHYIIAIDWGVVETFHLLTEGAVPLAYRTTGDSDSAALLNLTADDQNVFVSHTAGNEILTGSAQRLIAIAATGNRERVLIETIFDRNGRAMFELFSFRGKAAR